MTLKIKNFNANEAEVESLSHPKVMFFVAQVLLRLMLGLTDIHTMANVLSNIKIEAITVIELHCVECEDTINSDVGPR